MGTCCFTPRKYNFLWWYWLLLASIIGIPMLIAAMYVERKKRGVEFAIEDKSIVENRMRKVGRKAGNLFLILMFFFCIFGAWMSFFVIHNQKEIKEYQEHNPGFWDPETSELNWDPFNQTEIPDEETPKLAEALYLLFLESFLCIIMANIVITQCRKSKHRLLRIAVIVLGFVVWILANPLPFLICILANPSPDFYFTAESYSDALRPYVSIFTFACVLLAMYHWHIFIDRPTRRNIWKSIGAIAMAAILYYGAEHYGNLWQFHGSTAIYSKYNWGP